MKKFFVLFLGESSRNHMAAITHIIEHKEFIDSFQGFEFIPFNDNDFVDIVSKKIDSLKEQDIEPIIMKGFNIHTEDYIRPLIKYYKNKHPKEKFFLSHCACFNNFILTDGALLTKYTKENIESVIKNAIELRNKLKDIIVDYRLSKTIVMLNAGGDTNFNTAPDYWKEIYDKLPKETDDYRLEMTQLDVALSESIRLQKKYEDTTLPTIVIPSSINEANSIWKTLTVVAQKYLAGIVVGLPMYIGLTSRTDSDESICRTLDVLLKIMKKDNKDE